MSDSKIRSTTGRTSAVPQCFQPARFSFLNWLEFCLVEKRIAQRAGRRSGHFEVVSGHFEVVRRQAATAARAPRAAAEGRPGHHQCPSHRRRGGSGADRPSISGGATAVVGAPAGAARRGCHRTGRRAPGGAFVGRSLRRPWRAEHPRVASRRIGEQRKLLASPLGSAAAPAAFSDLKPTLSADRSI